VAARYRTPLFPALKQYNHRPTGVFHALPISRGKSIVALAPTFLYFRTDANYCYVVIC
jgi:arginine/lysine/ornithine decarboxylase